MAGRILIPEDPVSEHYFRRTARRKARKLNAQSIDDHYRVERARRGPYLWIVRRYRVQPLQP